MASTSTLEILLKLRDEASSGMKSASDSLRTMQSNLAPAADASKAFAVGLAAVGAAAGAAGVYAVAQARESIAAQKQLEAVLKSTSGAAGLFIEDLNDQAAALSKLTNYTDDAVTSAQSMLLTFTNIKGPIFQEAIGTILDMSTALGQDLKASAMQLGKALNDPIEGVNALRRVGVNFNETQQEMIKNLVESGKVAEAQKLILKELAVEFGGSAKAVADPWIQAQNALGEAAETIGMKLVPAANVLAAALTHFAEDILPKMIDTVSGVVNFMREWPIVFYAVAGAIIGALVPAFISMTISAATAAATMAIALAPFLIGGAIIGALVAGIVWLVQNWDLVKAKAAELWGAVAAAFSGMYQSIVAVFTSIGEFFSAVWEGIAAAVSFGVALVTGLILMAFEAMGIDLGAVFTSIQNAFSAVINFVTAIWLSAWGAISNAATTAWSAITGAVDAGWAAMVGVFQAASEPVKQLWTALWEQVGAVVTSTWEAIKGTITGAINFIIEKVNKLIEAINTVAQKGAGALKIKVPNIPKIPMLAQGGIVTRPTLAMIGEGSEPEAVIPLSRLGSFAGAGGVNVYISGNTFLGDPREAARQIGNELVRYLKDNMRL